VAVGPALTMAASFIYEWLTKKRSVPHDVLFTIARFSGFALLAYLYIKIWDLAALTYYGRLPAQNEALALLNQTTSYGVAFWIGEILLGILFPVVIFLSRRWNRDPVSLVMGAVLAVGGLVMNRWDVTTSGLTVPLSYSPGTLYQAPTGIYWPSIVEWGIAVGVIGYFLLAFTLGVRMLPIFSSESHS
jgi:Ni/Fe-hydrogenase subunit HybB-like protein